MYHVPSEWLHPWNSGSGSLDANAIHTPAPNQIVVFDELGALDPTLASVNVRDLYPARALA